MERGAAPLATAERSLLVELIKTAASVAGIAAGVLERDDESSGIIVESARGELGLELGRLNATISEVMSTGVPDKDFALEGMRRTQERFRDKRGKQ